MVPSGSGYGRLLLEKARPGVEAARADGRSQLGPSDAFHNSLRMAWTMSWLAEAGAS